MVHRLCDSREKRESKGWLFWRGLSSVWWSGMRLMKVSSSQFDDPFSSPAVIPFSLVKFKDKRYTPWHEVHAQV
jgi:hypothetical protein